MASSELDDDPFEGCLRDVSYESSDEHFQFITCLLNAPLKTLSMRSIGVNTWEIAEVAGSCISQNQTLRFLDISGNSMGPKGLSKIASGLKSSSLEKLVCEHTVGDDTTAVAFSKVLNSSKIQHLSLQSNVMPNSFKAFGKVLQHNKKLQSLDLEWTGPTTQSLVGLPKALKSNSTLTYLSFKYCRLRDESFKFLGQALGVTGRLRKLEISSNDLSDQGGHYLVNGLKKNRSLTHLSCEGHHMSGEGVNAFLLGLSSNPNLQILDLTGGEGDLSCASSGLSSVFSNCLKMTSFVAAGSYYSTEGAIAIANAIKKHGNKMNLAYLMLSSCKIGGQGIKALFQSFSNLPTLESLNIYDNQFDSSAATAVRDYLLENPQSMVRISGLTGTVFSEKIFTPKVKELHPRFDHS